MSYGFVVAGCAATKPATGEETGAPSAVGETEQFSADDANSDATAAAEVESNGDAQESVCEGEAIRNEQVPQAECLDNEKSDEALLDRTQQTVYSVVDGTTRWVDSFFGDTESTDVTYVSRGSVAVSGLWDERDGFDSRFRFRARFALPALENRTRLILGRSDADDIIDGSSNEAVETMPGGFDDDRDDDWLIGLGFNRSGDLTRGWDFGAGVRLSTPLDPYVNATYRWSRSWNDAWIFRVNPRLFWQDTRGTGITVDSDLLYELSPALKLRWANNFGVEERVEGLGWRSDLILYQSLANDRAFAYGIFAEGETDAEVALQNSGFEIRYRQRFTREWFFIVLSSGFSWPREFLIEERVSNFGVGLTFEMRFGRW